jgi:hypothetical protein
MIREGEPGLVLERANGGRRAAMAVASEAPIAALLQAAVEKGTPPEQLGKLVDLYERMEALDARKQFFAAMARFQEECPAIPKTSTAEVTSSRTGSKFSYTYADLDEIVATIRPYLIKNGLSYNWDSEISANGAMLTVICTVRHEAGHSERSKMTLPVESSAAMSPQQKYGAALTFAQRRTLSSALGLVTTDSEDPKVDPAKVTAEQVAEIERLLGEAGADPEAFLEYIGAESVAAIPANKYQQAVSGLRQRIATNSRKAATQGSDR